MKRNFSILVLLLVTVLTNMGFVNHKPSSDDEQKYYALVIAIDEYKSNEWSSLKTPVNDANAIKDVLSGKYGFEEVIYLYDEDATRANILNYLDKLAQNVTSNDNILVYFSGHGIELGNEGYWVPSDAKGRERSELIPNSEIKNSLAKTEAKHALVFVDACFSGTIFKSSNLFIENDGSDQYYKKVDALVSRQAITAGGLEPVLDGQGEHSIFAKYLIKYLKKNQKPIFDAGELYEMLKYPVQANSPNMPRFGHIQNAGHEGGQFTFRINKESLSQCNFGGVKIKEGEKIVFPEDGGMLHALVNEYDKKVNYQWIKGAAPMAKELTPNLKVTESGTYSIIVTTDDDCSDAAVIEVMIALPDMEVQIQEGSEVTFTNMGTLNAILSTDRKDVVYEWSKNNFIIGQEPSLNIVESGTYQIDIRLKDGRKIATSSAKVTIKDRTYTVRIGDNMARIARKFYGDVSKEDYLYRVNAGRVNKGELLRVGTELIVPMLEKQQDNKALPNEANSRVYLVANQDMPPFSQVGLYKNGMLTEMVKENFKESGKIPVVDFEKGAVMRAKAYSGKAAAAFPCVYNEQEEKFFHFSDPIYEEVTVLFISKMPPLDKNGRAKILKYKKDRDLKGLRIATLRGIVPQKISQLQKKRTIGVLAYNSWEKCFEKLKAGEVDMVAAPQTVGILSLKNAKNVNQNDFKILPKSLENTKFYLMVSKQHPDGEQIIKEFNANLKKLDESGKNEKIKNTHIDIFQKN
jgi:LysM repeat protein/uncharacterized protein YcgL (UPF0745 family)